MQLISSNHCLARTLSRLITNYSEIRLAVAWASSGNSVFTLLTKKATSFKKVIIGTHFYQTHPDVIDSFRRNSKVRFILQPSGVFHPKLYLFGNKDKWEALIGSANLTSAALNTNSETMLLISSSDDGAEKVYEDTINIIDSYWNSAQQLSKSDAAAYRKIWEQKKPKLRQIIGQYGANNTNKPPTSSAVMSMGWKQYFRSVKNDKYHGFEERCELLETVGRAFSKYPTLSHMPLPLRKTIAGLPNDLEEHWGWFGSMQGAGYYHQAVNNNNEHLSDALGHIPLHGTVRRTDYVSYINEFVKAFPKGRHGIGISSRLLALKRPDQFVCLDAKNQKGLCEDFGIVRSGLDYDRYWDDIIERIMDAPWWNSTEPRGNLEASVWRGRAAMLDAIFYRE